jgi:hypothetical protein
MMIAVATRDRPDAFVRLLGLLRRQITPDLEKTVSLFVTFDGCEPYGLDELDAFANVVEITHNEEARGFAVGRNAAVQANGSAVIAFLDDDACPGPRWLSAVYRGLETYPDLLAFGGRVRRLPTQHGILPLLRDAVYYRETFGAWYLVPDDDDDGGDGEAPFGDLLGPPYVNGANSAYRAETFERYGLFRPDLPACVDIEYGRRFGARANAVLLAGMAIEHEHPDRIRGYLTRSVRAGQARRLMASTFPPDAPRAFAVERVKALLWTDLRRLGYLPERRVQGAAVLTVQELAQLYGYLRKPVPR